MKTHITTFALGLATLVLGAGAAHAQDSDIAARRRAAAADSDPQRAPDVPDVSADELPAVQRVIEDEAAHRDRLARIHRLRELAQADGNRERLARLDDLEREEQQVYEARRLRARESLSEQDWNTAENLVRQGGRMRVRRADAAQQAQRERAAAHNKTARERAAEADKSRQAQRSSSRSPTRAAPSRSGSNSSGNSSGGGRSPR